LFFLHRFSFCIFLTSAVSPPKHVFFTQLLNSFTSSFVFFLIIFLFSPPTSDLFSPPHSFSSVYTPSVPKSPSPPQNFAPIFQTLFFLASFTWLQPSSVLFATGLFSLSFFALDNQLLPPPSKLFFGLPTPLSLPSSQDRPPILY